MVRDKLFLSCVVDIVNPLSIQWMLRLTLKSLWLRWVWLLLTHRKGSEDHDDSVVVAHSCTFSLW